MTYTVLLVEDNAQILRGNARMLRKRGYGVLTALTLREARERLAEQAVSAIVLDIMLPDGSGLDFMRELRQRSNIPILLLTGLTAPEDVVRGLSEGGDDYLTKPYDFNILLARLEALLRRSGRVPDALQKGALSLDVMAGQATVNGGNILLTRNEFSLLLFLAQNEGSPIDTAAIYERVWKQPMAEDDGAIKNAVYKLRKKLSGSGYTVVNTRGEGYCFEKE